MGSTDGVGRLEDSLARATMAAAVVCNSAVAVIGKEEHLILPIVAVQWPAMGEENDRV